MTASTLALAIARNIPLVRTLAKLGDKDLSLALRAMVDGEPGVHRGEFIRLVKTAVGNFQTSQLEVQGMQLN